MTPRNGEIEVKNLDHLGLVARIIDELGIVEIINEQVGIQPGEIVNAGLVVKAIIMTWIRLCLSTFIFIPSIFSRQSYRTFIRKRNTARAFK